MKRWWILKDRLRHGPFSEAELAGHLQSGRFSTDDFVASEESQGVTQLSHRTIREVLAHLSGAPPLAEPGSTLETVERRNFEMRPDDVDGMPGIRELIAKIEAVELVDSAGRSDDAGLQFPTVQHSQGKDFIDSFSTNFKRAAPALGVLAVLGLAFAFFSQDGVFDGNALVERSGGESARQPASSPPQPVPVSSRAPQTAPRVTLPKLSERSTNGFEPGAMTLPEIEQRNLREDAAESGEMEASRNADGIESTPDRSISSRRDRLRKLRNSMAPDAILTPGQPLIPGIADQGEDQQNYDESRDPTIERGRDDANRDENADAPYVDPDDMVPSEDVRENVDENVDVEYQE